MTVKPFGAFTLSVFFLTALGITVLVISPKHLLTPEQEVKEQRGTRVITVQNTTEAAEQDVEHFADDDSLTARVALNSGEVLLTLLTENFDGEPGDEQIVAYRRLSETESPIYVTYIAFDKQRGEYRRLWSAQSLATRPGTISLSTEDLVGDRSLCILLSGMNGKEEYTLTVFRMTTGENSLSFDKIAELNIDGMILVQKEERTQAYQRGIQNGRSFPIVTRGHDTASPNAFDQVEITYTYNQGAGRYEQGKITRMPGNQIEQRRLQEVLTGGSNRIEAFIEGLWYYVSPEGTTDKERYIYFSPQDREIIFSDEDTQQVFTWQQSSRTRSGLYITTRNISVTTLRRFLDVELATLDSIRVNVSEDVRLKIAAQDSWDGRYRKADTVKPADNEKSSSAVSVPAYINAVYSSSIGRFEFSEDGSYTHSQGDITQRGRYVFFLLDGRLLLEFRPDLSEDSGGGFTNRTRELYLAEGLITADASRGRNLLLRQISLGVNGLQVMPDPPFSLVLQ
jgi:hypothetical protein